MAILIGITTIGENYVGRFVIPDIEKYFDEFESRLENNHLNLPANLPFLPRFPTTNQLISFFYRQSSGYYCHLL